MNRGRPYGDSMLAMISSKQPSAGQAVVGHGCWRNSPGSFGNGEPETIVTRSRSNNTNGPCGVSLKIVKTINAYTVVKSNHRSDWHSTAGKSAGIRILASLEKKSAKILARVKAKPRGEKPMPDLTVCECNQHGPKIGVEQ